ncbi:transporter [Flavobacterium wongokense]|uniref:transporter n=1 Tax=Flavobacterium wongokense TaxID=2910674 RepID=UPI001F26AB21|nr:transporter [Flavobacterium sp. WG47]MCF6132169.1 transporter [Flavobacterium sp. WG47]
MKKTICAVAAFLLSTYGYSQCACCAGAGTGAANGDYNNGILTLNKNQFVLETYADYRKINQNLEPVTDVTEEEAPLTSMLIQSLGVRYGITKSITVSALLPYVFLNTDTGNDSGFGDLMLLGTFNAYTKNNFSLALQAGIELPTGIQKDANFDNTTVVVGSGSYDPMAGIILSKRWDKITLQGNALYKHTTKGFHDNYYGSISIQNLSLSYNIKGGNAFCALPSDDKSDKAKSASSTLGWAVFGGYYGEWLDMLEEDGEVDHDSGYYLGYATLGNNISYKKWSFPLTLSLPVIQNMNGEQNTGGFRLRLGIIKSF